MKILLNRCKCLKCGDIITSRHVHDFVMCRCGAIFTDGGVVMSADNWALCPSCGGKENITTSALEVQVGLAYGRVSAYEYSQLLKLLEAERATKREPERTLREDYEIGIWDGRFHINYSGWCNECGFSYEYKLDEPVTV